MDPTLHTQQAGTHSEEPDPIKGPLLGLSMIVEERSTKLETATAAEKSEMAVLPIPSTDQDDTPNKHPVEHQKRLKLGEDGAMIEITQVLPEEPEPFVHKTPAAVDAHSKKRIHSGDIATIFAQKDMKECPVATSPTPMEASTPAQLDLDPNPRKFLVDALACIAPVPKASILIPRDIPVVVSHRSKSYARKVEAAQLKQLEFIRAYEWSSPSTNILRRIDSLDPRLTNGITWTIFGAQERGIFYAQPKCSSAPMFIRVYIKNFSYRLLVPQFQDIRGRTVEVTPAAQLALRLLSRWSAGETFGSIGFKKKYESMPLGSTIAIWCDNDIKMRASSEVSWVWSTFEYLRNIWGRQGCNVSVEEGGMPPMIEFEKLRIHNWIHDTVTVVTIEGGEEDRPGEQKLYAFKSLPKTGYMYHEIRQLLTIPRHPNIIQPPSYLVTKQSKRQTLNPTPAPPQEQQPIRGFLTPYYPSGSLYKAIISRNHRGTLTLRSQVKWCRQLASALLHIARKGGGGNGKPYFYTDMKMDNLLLSPSDDLILHDFESGGNWSLYEPEEVYKYDIANHPEPGSDEEYTNLPFGHCRPFWKHSKQSEREEAMSYSLGICLWCILDGCGCKKYATPKMTSVINGFKWNAKCESTVPSDMRSMINNYCNSQRRFRPSLNTTFTSILEWEYKLFGRTGSSDQAFAAAQVVDEDKRRRASFVQPLNTRLRW